MWAGPDRRSLAGVPLADETRARRPSILDVVIAVGFTVAVLAITAAIGNEARDQRPLDWLGVVLVLVAGLSLAWRRVVPVATLVVATAAVGLYAAFDIQGGPVYLAPLIAIFSIAGIDGRRRAVPYAVGATAVSWAAAMARNIDNGAVLAHLLYLSWAVGAVLLGDAVHNRHEYLKGLEERARYLEETREEEARRRVAEERLRIARDLHDVIAHSLASINIQSGAGLHVIERHPEQAGDALVAIKRASKEALDELRATLDTLREDRRAPRAPSPGLADLAMLTTGAEQAGIPVEVNVAGPVRRLPPAVELTAYRIIQESLTNVMRHAGPARAVISVTYASESIDIEVVDDGRGSARAVNDDGHGIRGMHERAAIVGGQLEAGPNLDGGFRVRAHLPSEAVSA
jgi:signal transduction histidine kinase